MKTLNLLKLIRTIILSRIKKTKPSELVEYKREICKTCEYNTLNLESIPPLKLILKKLSDFYSWITGKAEVDVLGNCSVCGCSVYYKTVDEDICPHPKKDLWEKIYIPNSAQKEKWKN